MSLRVCAEPACPALVSSGRCPEHRAERERARGTRQQRGYDADHITLRKQWGKRIALGGVKCWRCGKEIAPGQPWHLGHDDNDRRKYRGPEHPLCNLSAAGIKSHAGQ